TEEFNAVSQDLLEACAGPVHSSLSSQLSNLTVIVTGLVQRAQLARDELEASCRLVEDLHCELGDTIHFLTQSERELSLAQPVSRLVSRVVQQVAAHAQLRRNITAYRTNLVRLDAAGAHVRLGAQKKDVVLVRNLLTSVHTRWEKLVARSAERTRQLDIGYKVLSGKFITFFNYGFAFFYSLRDCMLAVLILTTILLLLLFLFLLRFHPFKTAS
ncbi:unnamed protein product, partial [Protopolystoma xenopodis]